MMDDRDLEKARLCGVPANFQGTPVDLPCRLYLKAEAGVFRGAGFHPWEAVFKLHLQPWKFCLESSTVASLFGGRVRTRSNIFRESGIVSGTAVCSSFGFLSSSPFWICLTPEGGCS